MMKKILLLFLVVLGVQFSFAQYGLNDDLDGDGIINSIDVDSDNDGVPNFVENKCSFSTAGMTGTLTNTPLTAGASYLGYPFNGTEYYQNAPTSSAGTGSFTYNFTTTLTNIYYGFANNDFVRRWFTDCAGNPVKILPVSINAQTKVEYDSTINQWVWYDIDPTTYNGDNSANGVIKLIGNYSCLILHYAPNQGAGGTDGSAGGFMAASCNDALDTDGDGIPNYLDLDSDNDGCNDSFESGLTTNLNQAQLPGPYGINGQANSLETADTFEPWTYFLPLYDLYTLSKTISSCKDFDGDGLRDIDDIDDDNDGILDAVESPSCYMTAAEQPMSGNRTNVIGYRISSDLIFTQSLTLAIDGIQGTAANDAKFVNAQEVNQNAVVKIEFPYAVELSSFNIVRSGTILTSNSTLVLQGSNDNSTWTNLNTAAVYAGSSNLNFAITQNSAEYKFYRVFGPNTGTQGGVFSGGTFYVDTVLNTTNYIPSKYPKPTCTGSDYDGDGMPNHLDLDSDTDGCPDAIEGTNTTFNVSNLISQTNQSLSGASDAFGLPLQMNGVAQGLGTSQNPLAFDALCSPPYCTDPSQKSDNCDYDGDGVLNIDDIDKDNDGILDIYEMTQVCSTAGFDLSGMPNNPNVGQVLFTNRQLTTANTVYSGATFSFEITEKSGNGTASWPNLRGNANGDLAFGRNGNASAMAGKFTFSQKIGFTVSELASLSGNTSASDNYQFTVPSSAKVVVNDGSADLATDFTYSIVDDGTNKTITLLFLNTGTTSSDWNLKFYDIDQMTVRYYSSANDNTAPINFLPCTYTDKDTDGDGISDQYDLDSDNDGCLDAIEGDENVTTAMLTNAGGVASVGTGSSANNQNLGITVDSNGVPTIVNSGGGADVGGDHGQGIGTSINAAVHQCVLGCYTPANRTNTGIDTQHGITLLKRAGGHTTADVVSSTDWPMVRKSGHTVLESNTKGFVITRMATSDLGLITHPVDGMMVYDTTAKCLKIYVVDEAVPANSAWKCFSTPACP